MISVILYGRNDSYGYNLHKRAALSLNCIAEVLSDPTDEILFVDYNTPDDFPTFPEAIEDTLTQRAKECLRVLRVRPHIHRRVASRSHLLALEPISRNIAIRRSSPDSRWILSTNTDMIFVPHSSGSLSQACQGLPSGFYHLPRFEIPESLWEGFDRLNAPSVIEAIRHWGSAAHLNEIIYSNSFVKFDGPGDFQLVERQTLFEIQGFHEGMLRGWHVDSNLAKRLFLKFGKVGDLLDRVYGYHCDHTRQVTPAHSYNRVENDSRLFVDAVTTSDIPEQAASWGCPDDEIEELRLARSSSNVYIDAIRDAIATPLAAPTEARYVEASYDKVDYDPLHTLPFLLDLFVNAPRHWRLAWFGRRRDTFHLFLLAWQRLGFRESVLVEKSLSEHLAAGPTDPCTIQAQEAVIENADAFVFDFGLTGASPRDGAPSDRTERDLVEAFARVVDAEHERRGENSPLRRLVTLNTIHNRFDGMVAANIAAAATPFSSRIRQGYIRPQATAEEWLRLLSIGDAGRQTEAGIAIRAGNVGVIFYGPYARIRPGPYRIKIRFGSTGSLGEKPNRVVLALEILAGFYPIDVCVMNRHHVEAGDVTLSFFLPRALAVEALISGLEIRLRSLGTIETVVKSVTVEHLGGAPSGMAALAGAVAKPAYWRSRVIGLIGLYRQQSRLLAALSRGLYARWLKTLSRFAGPFR